MTKLFMLATLILPWFTLFFAKPKTIQTYMPVTIFTTLLMTIIFQVAYTYKWWIIHEQIVPWGYMIDVGFVYGLFLIGTFWIFVLTSHNFLQYTVVNIIMDAIMAFVVLPLLNVLGIASYENMAPWQYFLVIYGLSFVIFIYHNWQQSASGQN